LDAAGNAFVNDYNPNGYTAKLTPLGAVSTTAALTPAVTNAINLAVDSTGLIWTPSYSNGGVYKVSNSTTFSSVVLAEPTGTLATNYFPDSIAVGSAGTTYIADPKYGSKGELLEINNYGASTTQLLSQANGGTTLAATKGCLTKVEGVVVDGNALWVVNNGPDYIVCRISPDGNTVYAYVDEGTNPPGITEADAVAAGNNNSAWALDVLHADLYNVSSSGTATGPFQGGGMAGPVGLIADGLGYVWVVNGNNGGSGSISEFSPTGATISGSIANPNTTPATPADEGFQYGKLLQPSGIGIDISGNIWVSNYANLNVLEVIGIAAPTAALGSTTPTKPIPYQP
jgi:hypothetical protein